MPHFPQRLDNCAYSSNSCLGRNGYATEDRDRPGPCSFLTCTRPFAAEKCGAGAERALLETFGTGTERCPRDLPPAGFFAFLICPGLSPGASPNQPWSFRLPCGNRQMEPSSNSHIQNLLSKRTRISIPARGLEVLTAEANPRPKETECSRVSSKKNKLQIQRRQARRISQSRVEVPSAPAQVRTEPSRTSCCFHLGVCPVALFV